MTKRYSPQFVSPLHGQWFPNYGSPQMQGLIHWCPLDFQNTRLEYLTLRESTAQFNSGLGRIPTQMPEDGEPCLWWNSGTFVMPTPPQSLQTPPVTISVWYAPWSIPGAGGLLFWVGHPSTWSSYYVSFITTEISLMHAEATVFNAVAQWPTTPMAGRIYHVVGVYESLAKRSLYVNGIHRATNTYDNTVHGTNVKTLVQLNADMTGTNAASGFYRDFRIYNRALKPDEVWALYAPDSKYDLYTSLRARSMVTVAEAPLDVPETLPDLGSWYRADQKVWSRSSVHTDGNTSYLSAPHSSTLSLIGGGGYTVGGWMWIDAAPPAPEIIVAKRDITNVEWQIYVNTPGITFTLYNGSTYPGANAALPSLGAWHFVVARWHQPTGGMNIMVDDAVVGSGSAGAGPTNGTGSLGFGVDMSALGTYNWAGRLQNWFTSARYMSEAELSFLWNGGAGRHYGELSASLKTDMRSWWPMDEKSGSRRDVHGGVTLTDNGGVTESDGKVLNPIVDGARVYKWEDLGPKALHVTQDTLANRPTWIADAINGQPAIDFEQANNERLEKASVALADLPVATNDASIVTAILLESPSSDKTIVYWAASGRALAVYPSISGGFMFYSHGDPSVVGGRVMVNSASLPPDYLDTWHVLEAFRDTNIAANFTLDGAVLPPQDSTAITTDLLAGSATWYIGDNGVGAHLDGRIAELLFYRVHLSTADLATLRDYLNDRYFAVDFSSLYTGLVSGWRLDEASGTRMDSWGTNHLTDNNTVTQTTGGPLGNWAQFTAANSEYLSRATNATLSPGDTDFTIAAWVQADSLPVLGSAFSIMGKDSSAAPTATREYIMDLFAGGVGPPHQFRFYVMNGGVSVIVNWNITVTTNTRYLVIAWHDAVNNTIAIQVNDTPLQAAVTGGTFPQSTAAEFRIGARDYAGFNDYLNGKIGPAYIWNRILTPFERSTLYNEGNGIDFPEAPPAVTGLIHQHHHIIGA